MLQQAIIEVSHKKFQPKACLNQVEGFLIISDMSRFKFRAWDSIDNIMHDVEFIRPEKEVGCIIEDDKPIHVMDWERVVVMQSIAIDDKNGKEIYEGDILDLYVKEKWADAGWVGRGIVFWDEDSAKFMHGFQEVVDGELIDGYRPSKCFWNGQRMEVEVIGNYYENRDLVEDE